MTIEINHLRDRARSFRRRAEWMMDGADREHLIARATTYDSQAVRLAADREADLTGPAAPRPSA